MKRLLLVLCFFTNAFFSQNEAIAHCQMPCGIYHDNMVYDQIDQYVETMFKGVTEIQENKHDTTKNRSDFIRWIVEKENESNEVASLLTTYFLQQKIKPDEDDTAKRLASVHRLLFMLMQIKQNVDRKFVDVFADEWEKFKLMFHVEGYECQVEMMKQRNREKKLEQAKKDSSAIKNDHVHDHDNVDHDHDHEQDHTH